MIEETKCTRHYNFQIKDGWTGTGFLVFSQGREFNNFSSKQFENGMLLDNIAILFNKNLEIDDETFEIIKLLVEKSRRNKIRNKNRGKK